MLKDYQALAKSKAKRISSKDTGVSSTATIKPEYWKKKKADQDRWAKEDADKKKRESVGNEISHKGGVRAEIKGAQDKFKKDKAVVKKDKSDDLEAQSKKAGFYVHGHKNYGDVYEP